jgi:hypothetical protein
MDKRDDHQQEDAGGEKADALIHDQVDHERATLDTQRLRKLPLTFDNRHNFPITPPREATAGH